MVDAMCAVMGVLDIAAGILVIIGFGSSGFGLGLGIAMIGKGGMSFL